MKSKKKIKTKYISLDEYNNAIDYLKKGIQFIKSKPRDDYYWKWVIICLYQALYGFAVIFLNPGNYKLVLENSNSKKQKLIRFDEAIIRCQDRHYVPQLEFIEPLVLSGTQKRSIKFLSKVFRNNFIHFIPKIWLIEIHGMPQLIIDVLEVIRFLAVENGMFMHSTSIEKRPELEALINDGIEQLKKTKLYKETVLTRSESAILVD